MRGCGELAPHCEAVPILDEDIAKVKANVGYDELSGIGYVFDVCRGTQCGKLKVSWDRMKENLGAAIIRIELDPVPGKSMEKVGKLERERWAPEPNMFER